MKNLTNHEKKLFAKIARLKIKLDKESDSKKKETLKKQLKVAQQEYQNFIKDAKTIN